MQRTIISRAIGHSLAPIEPEEGGTLVAFSAKHGHAALDGSGANSPFASALVRWKTPGLEIGKLFRLVRDDVLMATRSQQEPFVYRSLPAEACSSIRHRSGPAGLGWRS
jgi:uncharacterized caspase-like protein